VVVCS